MLTLFNHRYSEVIVVGKSDKKIVRKIDETELEKALVCEIVQSHYNFIGSQKNPFQHISSKVFKKNEKPWYLTKFGIMDFSKVFFFRLSQWNN